MDIYYGVYNHFYFVIAFILCVNVLYAVYDIRSKQSTVYYDLSVLFSALIVPYVLYIVHYVDIRGILYSTTRVITFSELWSVLGLVLILTGYGFFKLVSHKANKPVDG